MTGNGYTSSSQRADVISVPTASATEGEIQVPALDLQELTQDEIKSLKTEDPFFYYSIPGVLAAKMTLKRVDYTSVQALCQGARHASSISEESKRRQTARTQVDRRSRVSFECHPSVLLEEDVLLGDLSYDESSDEEDGSSFNDDLDFLFTLTGIARQHK